MNKPKEKAGRKHHTINQLFSTIILINLAALVISMYTYGEKFLFWKYAFSYLGGINTVNGKPNYLSAVIFVASMIASGILCLQILSATGRKRNPGHKAGRFFLKTCTAGYFTIIVPYDVLDIVHVAGSAAVFGGLWFFINILLWEIRKNGEKGKFLLFQLLLQGTILPYAFLYVINSPLRETAQKFAIAGLMLALKLAVNNVPVESLRTGTEVVTD